VPIAVWIGVAALGGVGAVLRFVIDSSIAARLAGEFPWGTFAVNVSGSFALGVLSGAAVSGNAFLLAGTATVGAYTTFSTWMFETHRLGEDDERRYLIANVVGSLAVGLAALALGHVIGAAL
jgi:CrcB protein